MVANPKLQAYEKNPTRIIFVVNQLSHQLDSLTTGVAVASLPPAGNIGSRGFVTNATATLTAGLGAIVAGGGTNKVPVYDDGTNWRIG
jgi:hypothetical protein